MFSIGQVLKLKPGTAEEYKRRHDELWREMHAAMSKAQINMVIYRHGDLLFVYASAPDKEAFERVDRDPVTPKWDKYMSDVLESDANGTPWTQVLPQMFKFGNLE